MKLVRLVKLGRLVKSVRSVKLVRLVQLVRLVKSVGLVKLGKPSKFRYEIMVSYGWGGIAFLGSGFPVSRMGGIGT